MLQVLNIIVLVAVYAGVVYAQLSAGEWALREAGRCVGAILRAVLSVLHAGVGWFIFLGVEILLNVIVHGNYLRPAFGPYSNLIPISGGLFGLFVPWLPLLRARPPKLSEQGAAPRPERLTGRTER